MPGFDGTGPTGAGPRTGRGMGPCGSGYGYGCPYAGQGRGWGYGFRRFWRSPKNDLRDLEAEKAQLEDELDAIKEEIATTKKQAKNE